MYIFCLDYFPVSCGVIKVSATNDKMAIVSTQKCPFIIFKLSHYVIQPWYL